MADSCTPPSHQLWAFLLPTNTSSCLDAGELVLKEILDDVTYNSSHLSLTDVSGVRLSLSHEHSSSAWWWSRWRLRYMLFSFRLCFLLFSLTHTQTQKEITFYFQGIMHGIYLKLINLCPLIYLFWILLVNRKIKIYIWKISLISGVINVWLM